MNERKRPLVAFIEDDAILLKTISESLEEEGFDMLPASNGEEGLEKVIKEHPDIILLDILLPKMDGLIMLKKLREDEWGKNVPVIILTNLRNSERLSRALELGARDYLVKSDWRIDDVISKVKEKAREGADM